MSTLITPEVTVCENCDKLELYISEDNILTCMYCAVVSPSTHEFVPEGFFCNLFTQNLETCKCHEFSLYQ